MSATSHIVEACYDHLPGAGDFQANDHGGIVGDTIVLNPYGSSWIGDHYESLTVNGVTFPHPTPGVPYGTGAPVTAWQVCKGTTTAVVETTTTPAPATTAAATTTTTVADTTTTDAAATTTSESPASTQVPTSPPTSAPATTVLAIDTTGPVNESVCDDTPQACIGVPTTWHIDTDVLPATGDASGVLLLVASLCGLAGAGLLIVRRRPS